MAFYPLARLLELHDGFSQAYTVAGYSLLLVQEQGRRYLMHNQCPHQQAPLTQARVANGKIRCPVHGMQFDLVLGTTEDGCSQRLRLLPLAYEGNTVGVDL